MILTDRCVDPPLISIASPGNAADQGVEGHVCELSGTETLFM